MPPTLAEITEVSTALGMLAPKLQDAFAERPAQLRNVPNETWDVLRVAYTGGHRASAFAGAFANGRFFLRAAEALRGRTPRLVEWKGPHRPPGDDAIPADLRIDRVYLVSCKHLSKIVLNASPSRLFERRLLGDERSAVDWFYEVAPDAYQDFYESIVRSAGLDGLPDRVNEISRSDRDLLRSALRPRRLPRTSVDAWRDLCGAVAIASAARWHDSLPSLRSRLETFWRMVRISGATYFVLGFDGSVPLRIRVGSKWDWLQDFELRALNFEARAAGQPEVAWTATIRRRADGSVVYAHGHVEVRWSHGRFGGLPEAKVYLDTAHDSVPGYYGLPDDDVPTLL